MRLAVGLLRLRVRGGRRDLDRVGARQRLLDQHGGLERRRQRQLGDRLPLLEQADRLAVWPDDRHDERRGRRTAGRRLGAVNRHVPAAAGLHRGRRHAARRGSRRRWRRRRRRWRRNDLLRRLGAKPLFLGRSTGPLGLDGLRAPLARHEGQVPARLRQDEVIQRFAVIDVEEPRVERLGAAPADVADDVGLAGVLQAHPDPGVADLELAVLHLGRVGGHEGLQDLFLDRGAQAGGIDGALDGLPNRGPRDGPLQGGQVLQRTNQAPGPAEHGRVAVAIRCRLRPLVGGNRDARAHEGRDCSNPRQPHHGAHHFRSHGHPTRIVDGRIKPPPAAPGQTPSAHAGADAMIPHPRRRFAGLSCRRLGPWPCGRRARRGAPTGRIRGCEAGPACRGRAASRPAASARGHASRRCRSTDRHARGERLLDEVRPRTAGEFPARRNAQQIQKGGRHLRGSAGLR